MGLDAGKVVAYLMLDTTKFESGIATGRSLIKTLSSDSATAAKKALAIGDALASTGKIMTLGLTAPIVGLGFAAVKSFTSFDDAMRQVTATMEASTEETQRMTEAAEEIGRTTQFSATTAATALNVLAAAGYDASTAITAMPTALKLAAAGNMDLEAATSMLTDSMSALGLGVEDMEGFVDQLAKGASVSNASISQLGEAILAVGGTAKMLKGGTVELNAELGILANNGLKGAEGGTMLRNIINQLAAPENNAAKAMKKYSLSVFDAQGNMRGLNDIMTDLAKIMDGWSDEKRTSLMSTLFNVRDLKAAEALLAGTTGLYADFSGEIENSTGAAQKYADTISGGLSGSMDKLKAAIEGLGIAFGGDLAPKVQQLADWVTDLTRGWAAMDEGMRSTILTIAGVAAAVGPALIVLGKLVTGVTAVTTALSGPAGWITLGVVGVTALAGALALLPKQGDAVDQALAKVDPDKVTKFKKGLESVPVNVDVNVNTDKINVKSIYETIYQKLTDGKKDTKEQGEQLNTQVQDYYDGLIAQINLDTETKLANLKAQLDQGFITMEEYQTRANAITTQNGTLIANVQSTCNDTLTYISEMSGKSTATVKASLDDLETIEKRAEALQAEIDKLAQEAGTPEARRAVKLVRSGAKVDEETTGLAFNTVSNQMRLDTDTAQQTAKEKHATEEADYEKALDAAQKRGASDAELAKLKADHNAKFDEIEKGLAADKARIQTAYLASLNELFAGLASQNPELQNKLQDALSKLDIQSALQKAIDEGTTDKLSGNKDLMDRLGKALGIDDPAAFLESYKNDPVGLQTAVSNYIAQLSEAVGKDTEGLENSPMGSAMQGLISDGLLKGLNFDDANMQSKLALALGQANLPQVIADAAHQAYTNTGAGGVTASSAPPVEVPMDIVPKPSLADGAIEGMNAELDKLLAEGLPGSGAGSGAGAGESSAPVVKMPVTVAPDPVVEEGSGSKLVDAVASDISASTSSVTTAAESISKAAATAFAKEVPSARSAGIAMVQGLIDGANSKKQSLITTFEGLMVAAIQAAKRKAGIASPSKVFRGIGQNIADAFSLGVDDRRLASQKTVEQLVGAPKTASVVNNNHNAAPINITFPGAVVRSDNDIRELERRTQRLARDLQYGLGARP